MYEYRTAFPLSLSDIEKIEVEIRLGDVLSHHLITCLFFIFLFLGNTFVTAARCQGSELM